MILTMSHFYNYGSQYASWKCPIIGVYGTYIMGVSRHQQWTENISNHELLRKFGRNCGLSCTVRERCMKWLGQSCLICRVDDYRQPKKILFGELLKSRLFHGIKQRNDGEDVVNADTQY